MKNNMGMMLGSNKASGLSPFDISVNATKKHTVGNIINKYCNTQKTY